MQKIVNIRVDERLIHGQVAAFWTNTLGATRIMVVDDISSKDDIQKMALKMACPGGVKLSILSIAKAAENLLANKYVGDRIFMVLKGPHTLLGLWEAGFKFDVVNVGNMSSKFGSVQVKRSVGVTPADVENFEKLAALGVKFTAQMVPTEEVIDFLPLIRKPDLFAEK